MNFKIVFKIFFKFYIFFAPLISSTTYWEKLKIHRKPEIDVSNSSKTVSLPGKTTINALIKGEAPVYLTLFDGTTEFKSLVSASNSNNQSLGYFGVTPLQSTTYQVKSIENACGITSYNPTQIFSLNVLNSNQRSIHLIKSPENICMGGNYQIEFLTTGNFDPANEFIVKLTLNINSTTYTYEVGRGKLSPLTINIPSNIPLNSVTNNCQFTITSIQTETENLPLFNRQSSASIIQNQTANIEYASNTSLGLSFISKIVQILDGESLRVVVNSPNTNISEKYNVRINDRWFNHNEYFTYSSINRLSFLVKPTRDTSLYLNKIENACGQQTLNDSLKIKVGNYRIRYAIIDGGVKCQGNYIDVMISVEGKIEK